MFSLNKIGFLPLILLWGMLPAQELGPDSTRAYKVRVLENTEIEFLTSYYSQNGDNAAVSGGKGTEELTDLTPTVIVSIPINDDDVLTIDAGISAYTSASSSNVDPFDGRNPADPFQASSGASHSDTWINLNGTYSHSSDDRNNIWTSKLSIAKEYDYFSLGLGGSYTKLFNQKNTQISLNGNVFLDSWKIIYPIELEAFKSRGNELADPFFKRHTVTGNTNYNPSFSEFDQKGRNSYSLGLEFAQILSKTLQGSLSIDLVLQKGLLSTPFQRVYFKDVDDAFIDNFQLADDIERLPDSRSKAAIGGRLHYYLNEFIVIRTYYRYYFDDWDISSHTASIEIPFKITNKFTIYPSYRYYAQTAATYFAPFEQNLSSEKYYSSDHDLSKFNANQYGIGITYTDIFTSFHVGKLDLKSVDLKFKHYQRDSGFKANIFFFGTKFILDQ